MTPTQEKKNAIRQRFSVIDTANVADVLDSMGLFDQGLAPHFKPFTGGPRLAGWAFTLRGQMAPGPQGGDAEKMTACHAIAEGEVSVWSGDGHGICYFGELIALGMRERGSVGALVDGGIRDIHWLKKLGFPVFAAYRTPVQSIGRWKVTGWQEPVWIAGATRPLVSVSPGDFILGDDDGVIAIPGEHVEQVLNEAERLTAQEARIRTDLASGLSQAQALETYGHV